MPLPAVDKKGNEVMHEADEGIRSLYYTELNKLLVTMCDRPGTNYEALSKLKSLKELQSKGSNTGRITAG